ncbi:cytochrome P450 4C1-like [Thrips palmi]|uniref:Cytochrome P450 4C1-like n=1 Tax=Thrips palmi TaxID=161013 RepID=A0A6P8YG61_THRPL|nr:cytochrome P450 4C1-like [Thrips palmi]
MTLLLLLPVLLLGLALLAGLLVLAKSSVTFSRLRKQFPAPPFAFLIGHVSAYWGDEVHLFKTMQRFRATMGRRWLIKMMNEHALNLTDAEGVEAVMTSSKHITKGPLYDFLLPWLGRGLLTNFGGSWHHRRKLLTPAFHFKILDEFGPLLAQHSEQLVDDLRVVASGTEPLDVVEHVSKITLGTICETAMGVNLHSCGEGDEYFAAVRTVGASVIYRMMRPWTWNDFVFGLTPHGREVTKCMNTLHRFTEKVIRERKSTQDTKAATEPSPGGEVKLRKRRLAFLDMLLAAQKEDLTLSDVDIRNEVDTFMFEGHETTAMAICWTLFALGNHPDIQERVRQEVLGAGPAWQDIVALPYLEQVVKESLRLYPPVLYISRINEQGLDIGDKHVESGVHLDMIIYCLHRDPANFPDPERFDPERFAPGEDRGRHPFAYVPFSGGLRNCIGKRYAMMELKLMVAAVARAFSWRARHSPEEIEFKPELVLRASQGIQLYLTPL